jgi:PEP-CTERM motif
MHSYKKQLMLYSFIGLLSLFAPGLSARADLVLGFPNGLNGPNGTTWDTSVGDPGSVTASGGTATITESTIAGETDLFLTFTVPTGASSLQFTLVSVVADSTPLSGVTPDAFGASLLDPVTGNSLVPAVLNSDSFYTRDVVDGPANEMAGQGVSVMTPPGVLAVVSVDLSSLGLDGMQAEVLFRLIGGLDLLSTSTVTISDVKVIAPSGAVPEPSSLVLLSIGLLSLAAIGRQVRQSTVDARDSLANRD